MEFSELYKNIKESNLAAKPKYFVELYEENIDIINSQSSIENEKFSIQIIQIRSDYANCLCALDQWSKALAEIDIVLPLCEQNNKFKNINLLDIEFYKSLKFQRAICNCSLKNFSSAIAEFDELLEVFPENERYKIWKVEAELHKIYQFQNILFYIIPAATVANVLLVDVSTLGTIISLSVLILSLVGALFIEIHKSKAKKQKKLLNQI